MEIEGTLRTPACGNTGFDFVLQGTSLDGTSWDFHGYLHTDLIPLPDSPSLPCLMTATVLNRPGDLHFADFDPREGGCVAQNDYSLCIAAVQYHLIFPWHYDVPAVLCLNHVISGPGPACFSGDVQVLWV